MRRAYATAAIILGTIAPISAQVPVNPVADVASYATAAINPIWAVADAWRSPQRACRLGQLAIAGGVGTLATVTLKRFIVSPRPCLGCAADGTPSGHTQFAMIGAGRDLRVGLAVSVGTGVLRGLAHRHTPQQIGAGLAIGAAAEGISRLLRCD